MFVRYIKIINYYIFNIVIDNFYLMYKVKKDFKICVSL